MPEFYNPARSCWHCGLAYDRPELALQVRGPQTGYRTYSFHGRNCLLRWVVEGLRITPRSLLETLLDSFGNLREEELAAPQPEPVAYQQVILSGGRLQIIPPTEAV